MWRPFSSVAEAWVCTQTHLEMQSLSFLLIFLPCYIPSSGCNKQKFPLKIHTYLWKNTHFPQLQSDISMVISGETSLYVKGWLKIYWRKPESCRQVWLILSCSNLHFTLLLILKGMLINFDRHVTVYVLTP